MRAHYTGLLIVPYFLDLRRVFNERQVSKVMSPLEFALAGNSKFQHIQTKVRLAFSLQACLKLEISRLIFTLFLRIPQLLAVTAWTDIKSLLVKFNEIPKYKKFQQASYSLKQFEKNRCSQNHLIEILLLLFPLEYFFFF